MELAQRDIYLRNLQKQLDAIQEQRNEIIEDIENNKKDNKLLKIVIDDINNSKKLETNEKKEQIKHMKELIRYLDGYIKKGNLSKSVLTTAMLQKEILKEHMKELRM